MHFRVGQVGCRAIDAAMQKSMPDMQNRIFNGGPAIPISYTYEETMKET